MKSGKQILFFFLLFFSQFCFSQNDNYKEDSILTYQLASHGVFTDDFIRKTFYTWTTSEQISELRKIQNLFVKSKSDTGGFSLYDEALRDSVFKGMPIIQLLKQPQFAKKRYAWINCWSTSMGMENEKYGDQLVKMELKDDAIIGKFNTTDLSNPIQFFNLKGDTMTCNYAIENQDRIAVIYHLNTMNVKRSEYQKKRFDTHYNYTSKYKREDVSTAYKEFIIINEKMITWSYGTDDIKKEISSEIDFLKKLQLSKHSNQNAYKDDCDLLKKNYLEYDDVNCAFESNKCFNIDYYMFNKERLQKIIDTLELDLKQQSAPITN